MDQKQTEQLALKRRSEFRAGDAVRDSGLKEPDDVDMHRNIPYGNDSPLQHLDLYLPKQRSGPLPVIVSVHGGGWVYGGKDLYRFYCMSLAQFGFAVVNFSYRLGPEWNYPASFEDMDQVLRLLPMLAKKYDLNLSEVFALGDSAGAHMLALYCCAMDGSSFSFPFPVQDRVHFQAIALNCGVYDFRRASSDVQAVFQAYYGKELTDSVLQEFSPVNSINASFPPCYVMAASADALRGQSELLIPVLKENTIDFRYKVYGTEEQPLDHVFHVNMKLPQAHLCNEEETDYFRSFLKDTEEKAPK